MLEVVYYRAMGDRLRERRRAMKLTQEELAERIDISASFVGHLERAEKTPSLDTVAALCAALEVKRQKGRSKKYLRRSINAVGAALRRPPFS